MSVATADHLPQPEEREGSVVREALVRFIAWSLVALVALGIGGVLVAQQLAREEALRDARTRGESIANTVAAPLVNQAVREQVPGAADELARVLANRMQDGPLRRVKLWASDGTVIWSDQADLVGERFELSGHVASLFGTGEVAAELSQLERAENEQEREEGELLEVYVGAWDADGQPLVVEAYLSTEQMRQDESTILLRMLPLALGGLLLFQLAVLPLAISLAHRVEHSREERAKMMRHALLASDLERRRIAQDLHDGVIQDLAGLAYALPSVEAQLEKTPAGDEARQTLGRASAILRQDTAALRAVLTDVYPPDLEGGGLVDAIQDLGRSMRDREVLVEVDVPSDLQLPIEASRLSYRVIREGLRNVLKHAQATTATVELRRADHRVVVRVCDNGKGLPESVKPDRSHVGLTMLDDTLRDFGGSLSLRPRNGQGAVLEASFPVVLVS